MKISIEHINSINGEVKISGSKNAALPLICASVLINKMITLKNVPVIKDVIVLIDILKQIGCFVKFDIKQNILKIKARKINSIVLSSKVKELRGSYYLMGSLICRYNKCIISYPGGCNFSERPIDYHLDVFTQLGFEIKETSNIIFINKKRNHNKVIKIKGKSVGTSINLLLTCAKVNEKIIVENILLEPEVLEVIAFLKLLGKHIDIYNDRVIMYGLISERSIEYVICGDRIEAGSYMLLASAIPNSKLKITNVPIKYMKTIFDVLEKIGIIVIVESDEVIIINDNVIRNIDLVISEYPSFPTDLQQILTTVLLTASNISTIKDNIYKNRISHINELIKLNAKIEFVNDQIIIYPSKLVGGEVYCKDLRCAFSLIVAALVSKQKTILNNFEVAFRGYENIINKLTFLGIDVKIYY